MIRFHGHECPGVTIGYRMATEAMKAIPSDGKLVAIAENRGDKVPADIRKNQAEFIKWLMTNEGSAFLTLTPVEVNEPEVARTRESAPCAECVESANVAYLRESGGKKICIPCEHKRDTPTK